MAASDLTAARLRELLHYDAETGVFTRLVSRGRRWEKGSVAGFIVEGYWRIGFGPRSYSAGRLAWLYMTGEWPTMVIDHKDGDRLNNIFSNLRDVSLNENAQNQRKAHSHNKSSGLLGVFCDLTRRKTPIYTSQIQHKGKIHKLGYFDTPEAAHEAYLKAKRQFHPGCTI